MLSSGWLASYVGQSEVPALITSLSFPPSIFFVFKFVDGHLFENLTDLSEET